MQANDLSLKLTAVRRSMVLAYVLEMIKKKGKDDRTVLRDFLCYLGIIQHTSLYIKVA